jgi:hypothetical protein
MSQFFNRLREDTSRGIRADSAGRSDTNEELLKTLNDCESMCEKVYANIRKLPDFNLRARQNTLLRECADMCNLTKKLIAHNSEHAKQAADLCSVICRHCGFECAKFSDNDSQQCSRVCIYCAQQCANYVNR